MMKVKSRLLDERRAQFLRGLREVDDAWVAAFHSTGFGDIFFSRLFTELWLRGDGAVPKSDAYELVQGVSAQTAMKYVRQATAEVFESWIGAVGGRLQGAGIANQRKAIIEGLKDSIKEFQSVVGGTSTAEVMQLVLITQYFDTIKSIGELDKTNTLFLSHSPGAVNDIGREILQSMVAAERSKD